MIHRLALLAALVSLSALAGCHPLQRLRNLGGSCHDVKPYQLAAGVAPLKIPAGLDAPDTTNALHIPVLNAPQMPARKKTDPCLDEPPSFKVPKQAPPQA